jgi:phage shock protein PspC (stress-responsive transcriptional regulator)
MTVDDVIEYACIIGFVLYIIAWLFLPVTGGDF